MKNQLYRFDTAIEFIDFHQLSLSIGKNHLIAIDFYQLTTLGKRKLLTLFLIINNLG